SAPLAANGGTTPYAWVIVGGGGNLPAGLHLHNATGVIDGTPTGTGTTSFTVQVTDSETPAVTVTQPLSITVGTTAATPTPAVPGLGQPGTFTPGLQGTARPLNILSTTAIPGQATPGTFTPGDPGSQSLPAAGPGFTPAIPGEASPGLFTPGDPGGAVAPALGVPFIVQEVPSSFTYNYGWSSTEF